MTEEIIKLNVFINDEDIKDIMDSACQGGVNYWCKRIHYKGKDIWKRAGQYVIDDLPISLVDYDGNTYELNKSKFIKAIEKHCTDVHIFNDRKERRRIDTDVFPCDIADKIVREAIGVGEFD